MVKRRLFFGDFAHWEYIIIVIRLELLSPRCISSLK